MRYRDADMALRRMTAGFLEAHKSFRWIQGKKNLWILGAALGRSIESALRNSPKQVEPQ